MSRRIGIGFSRIGGTGAGLGRTAGGQSVIVDRPPGRAGGLGLGCNGGELLAAAIGGCFWNDLHYVAEAEGIAVAVESVDVEVELAGNPGRIVRAHVRARLAGNEAHVLQRLFGTASEISAVSQSLRGAMQVTFEREE